MSDAEQSARRRLTLAASAGIVSAFLAISLGLNQLQGLAVVFLLVAVAAAVVAWLTYRRYSSLRQSRWDAELASAAQIFSGEEEKSET